MPYDRSSAPQGARWQGPRARILREDDSRIPLRERALRLALFGLIRGLARVHLARIRVLNEHRIPTAGPVLVVANHPATWMDALVLDVAMGRPLAYLVLSDLFHPAARGWLLRAHGAVPVSVDGLADAPARNAQALGTAKGLLQAGRWVAVFAEGRSRWDHVVGPLKTGAARLAIEHVAAGRPLHVLPVGIHYADRTAFRTEVTVIVGAPLDVPAPDPALAHDACSPVRALTDRLGHDLRTLTGAAHNEADEALRCELMRVLVRRGGTPFEQWARLGIGTEALRESDPIAHDALRRRLRRLARARRILHVSAEALAAVPRPAGSPARAPRAIDLVAAPLGTLGALLHVVPWTASEWAARRLGPDAPRRGFARIATSSVIVPASYAASLWWLVRARGVPFLVALTTMVVVGALGALSLAYRGRAAAASTLRIRWMEWRGSRLLTRARRDCIAIGRLAAVVDGAAPSHHPPRMEAS